MFLPFYPFEDWFGLVALIWAPAILFGALALVPLVDRSPYRSAAQRRFVTSWTAPAVTAVSDWVPHSGSWLARKDSNLQSPDPESGAVAPCLRPVTGSIPRSPSAISTSDGRPAPSESGSVRRTFPEESCELTNSPVSQAKSPAHHLF